MNLSDKISDCEFSAFSAMNGDIPSMETMYHNYQKLYKEKKCSQCNNTWWHKKTDPVESDLCWKCRKENIAKLVEQNRENF